MKQYWKLGLVGIVGYLLFLLYLMPASWVLKLVPIPPQLQLVGVSGTLWHGSVRQLSYQQLVFNDLDWQIKPLALLTFRLNARLTSGSLQQTEQPYLQAKLVLSPSSLHVHSALLRLPVATLLPVLSLPLPVAASGELILDVANMQLHQGTCQQLRGTASWLEARLQPPVGNWLTLGDFSGTLSCEQQHLVLHTDPTNLLSLDVRAELSPAGAFRVNGTLAPAAELPAEVHQAMRFVGQPDANGRYTLAF